MDRSTRPPEPPPGLARRLAAMLYDTLLTLGLLLFVSTLVTVPVDLILGREAAEQLPGHPLFRLALALVPPLFFISFWLRAGQTLGMRSWRLQVVRDDGKPLRLNDALLRFVAALFSWLACGAGFLWVLVDPQRRAWHDRLSRTRLITLPKR